MSVANVSLPYAEILCETCPRILTYILVVDAEIRLVVALVAAAESSGCAHLGDVRVGSRIVQAVQTAIMSVDGFSLKINSVDFNRMQQNGLKIRLDEVSKPFLNTLW